MADQVRKLSEILLEMVEQILRKSCQESSDEAVHAALFFANIAWNECVGIIHPREHYRNVWTTFEVSNPALWNELKSRDANLLIDELVRYKQTHWPDDQRRILACGMPNGNVRVEWLPAAAPGVDSKWEMRLYGLVMSDDRQGAIRYLQQTPGLSHNEAMKKVAEVAAGMGIK